MPTNQYQFNYIKDSDNQDVRREYIVTDFSSNNFFSSKHRKFLEEKFLDKIVVLDDLTRKSVSFQHSKNEIVHNWLKYKEGFSEQLVDFCIDRMNLTCNAVILDPFSGFGTTNFVCQMRGINSLGFDILPTSKLAIYIKSNIKNFDLLELNKMLYELERITIPKGFMGCINNIPITEGAYPENNKIELSFLTKWIAENEYTSLSNELLKLCIINSLEDISYTKKDGQYLRWDYRSEKVKKYNELRINQGKGPLKTKLDKGDIVSTLSKVKSEFRKKMQDIYKYKNKYNSHYGDIKFIQNSILTEILDLDKSSLDGVITSPPYCNRYDYTRSYALELVYLGLNDNDIKKLRQTLLSCTVENKSKERQLYEMYSSLNALERFESVRSILLSNGVYNEIVESLQARKNNNDLNNGNIINMFKNYIFELSILYAEIFRVCKNGSRVYFVNDNVRYGGEVIPIDFLSSEIAENLGFEISQIFCIKQKKGNSSQQMKKFGKVPLRKSITEWIVKK